MEVVVGQEQQQQKRQQQRQRSRNLLVEYDPNADPATVDSLEDIGECFALMLTMFLLLLLLLLIFVYRRRRLMLQSLPLCL